MDLRKTVRHPNYGNQQLPMRLPINNKPRVVTFGGTPKLYWDFRMHGVRHP